MDVRVERIEQMDTDTPWVAAQPPTSRASCRRQNLADRGAGDVDELATTKWSPEFGAHRDQSIFRTTKSVTFRWLDLRHRERARAQLRQMTSAVTGSRVDRRRNRSLVVRCPSNCAMPSSARSRDMFAGSP